MTIQKTQHDTVPGAGTALQNMRSLSVTFAEPIEPQELECFRGAIAEKAGFQHERFHNHNNAPGAKTAFHYRYPLIQYQLHRGQPRIVFLNEAIEDAQHFFTQSDWDLQLNGKPYRTKIAGLRANQHHVGVTPGAWGYYRLRRWQALNTDNYPEYRSIITLRDKAAFLERILAGHLLAFFTGIGIQLPHRFQLDLTDLYRTSEISYRGIQAQVFDIHFRAELMLPSGIGIGKGTGLGFGRVERGAVPDQNINPEKL